MKKILIILAFGLTLAACGGGTKTPNASGTTPPASASCSPSGTALTITAKNLAFDKTCLAAPAGQAFTIQFANAENGTTHNIAILAADPAKDPTAKVFFRGAMFAGIKTMTYNVGAIAAAGTYFFHCEVHPTQMFGTFVVA